MIGQYDKAHELAALLQLGRQVDGRRGRDGKRSPSTRAAVLAVDGGGSKTDLALVGADGALLGFARGPRSSPHYLGLDGSLDVLARLLGDAGAAEPPAADLAELLMAGVDFPSEEEEFRAAAERRG